jgi:hypothetical protein
MPSFHGLKPLPPDFAATVAALHRVAEEIVAPEPDNEIALRATPGGFGTPPFEFEGEQRQVRVEGSELVYRVGADEHRSAITSLAAGALVAGLTSEGPVRGAELGYSQLLTVDDPHAAGIEFCRTRKRALAKAG